MAEDLEGQVKDLLPGYALGCLDEAEERLVSQYLAKNPASQAELETLQATVDQLGLVVPEAEPSADLEQRLMARVRQAQSGQIEQSRPGWWQQLARPFRHPRTVPVLLALILILLIVNLFLWVELSQPTPDPAKMQAIPLTSTGLFSAANGYLLISADGLSGAVVVDQLPELENGGQYQLWLVRGDERVSAALVTVDELGYGGARVRPPEPLFNYSAVGMTIEPEGGSPAPTGERVLTAPLPK